MSQKEIEFTIKIKMPYHTVETANFYLKSVLEDIKIKKDLINISEFEILEANVVKN